MTLDALVLSSILYFPALSSLEARVRRELSCAARNPELSCSSTSTPA